MVKIPGPTETDPDQSVAFATKVRSNLGEAQTSQPTTTPVAAQNVTYEHNPFRPEIYRTTEGYLQ